MENKIKIFDKKKFYLMKVPKDHLQVNYFKKKEKAFIIVQIVGTNYFHLKLNLIAVLDGRHLVKHYQGPLKQK